MKPILTREFVADTLTQSILDHRSRALYDLCFLHRDHLRDVIVADKLRLIARLFAEYEAGPGFSPERGAHCLAKSPVDHWFATVATAEELDGWLPLELHKRLMNVFDDLPEAEARSLASKYLHFHFPELFYIHDSLVERAARQLVGEECGYLAMNEHDPAYGQFHACCRRLGERLARDLGRRLSPRELDRVLRAWLDVDEARKRDGVGCGASHTSLADGLHNLAHCSSRFVS